MSASNAPLPPRDQPTRPSPRDPLGTERRMSMLMTIVFFVFGLSVILSYNWSSGGLSPDAPTTILFGVLVAAIIYIGARYAMARPGVANTSPRLCAACGRQIPVDAVLCPYCGQRVE